MVISHSYVSLPEDNNYRVPGYVAFGYQGELTHPSARYFKLRIRDFPKDPNPNVRETRGIVGSHFG